MTGATTAQHRHSRSSILLPIRLAAHHATYGPTLSHGPTQANSNCAIMSRRQLPQNPGAVVVAAQPMAHTIAVHPSAKAPGTPRQSLTVGVGGLFVSAIRKLSNWPSHHPVSYIPG